MTRTPAVLAVFFGLAAGCDPTVEDASSSPSSGPIDSTSGTTLSATTGAAAPDEATTGASTFEGSSTSTDGVMSGTTGERGASSSTTGWLGESSSGSSSGAAVPADGDADGVFTPEDCDDADPRAFPGQAEFFETPRRGAGGFDFDCDGEETLAFPDLVECNPPLCGHEPGWNRLDNIIPACGTVGGWDDGYCQPEPGFCSGNAGPPTPRTQSCR